jgi:hypothetical protein
MPDIIIQPTSLIDVATTAQAGTKLISLPAGQQVAPPPPPDVTALNKIITDIQGAIADDKLANTAGNTAAPPPDNFRFTDLTVNVSGTTPGDVFKGTTPDVKFQFIDLTPDALQITAVSPNVFIKTDSGIDLLVANAGRNIVNAGGGVNTIAAGTGHDTILADATTGSAIASILNFGPGDDAAVLGVNATDFTFTLRNSLFGLEVDANPIAGSPAKNTAEILLQGYSTANIGSKLSLGISSTADGTSFLFVHAT